MSYTEEALDKLGIAQLRQVARQVGLTPSTLKKGELIAGILAISRGEAEKSKTTRKGRPAKDFGSLGQFMQSLLPSANEEVAEVAQPRRNELDLIVGAKAIKVLRLLGVVETVKSGFGYVRTGFKPSDSDALISELTILKHNLKEGDVVDAEVTLFESGVKTVTKILAVNGGNILSNRQEFSHFNPIFPTEKITFKNCGFLNKYFPIGKGQRAVLTGDDGFVVKNNILHLFKNCNESKFLLALNVSPEEAENYLAKELQPSLVFKTNEKLEMYSIRVMVQSLKRRVELGENVCLFVTNISQIYESVKDEEEFASYIQANFKNTTKGSLTLVCGYEGIMPSVISKAFNFALPLNTSLDAFGVMPCIDLTRVNFSRQDGLVEKANMADLALKVGASDKSIISLINILNEKV